MEAAVAEPTSKVSKAEAKARRQAERALGAKLPKTLHCSFCGKGQHQVQKLIAGPRGVFICDECVGLCNDVIAERADTQLRRLSTAAGPVDRRTSGAAAVDQFRHRGQPRFPAGAGGPAARARGQLGGDRRAAGVSRQSAWERFS
jgi:hypothetical protein